MRHLDRIGVPFVSVDIREDPEAAEFVRSLGHQQTPVVVVDGPPMRHWSGYRRDELDSLQYAESNQIGALLHIECADSTPDRLLTA